MSEKMTEREVELFARLNDQFGITLSECGLSDGVINELIKNAIAGILDDGFRKVDEALVEKIGDMVERNIRVDGFFSPAEIAAKVLEDSR